MAVKPAIFLAFALGTAAVAEPAPQRREDAQQAYRGVQEGRLLPLREIERRVVPMMRGWQYIGFDFDSGSGIYTLKFLRDGTVAWIDVDGRSGGVVGRSGR